MRKADGRVPKPGTACVVILSTEYFCRIVHLSEEAPAIVLCRSCASPSSSRRREYPHGAAAGRIAWTEGIRNCCRFDIGRAAPKHVLTTGLSCPRCRMCWSTLPVPTSHSERRQAEAARTLLFAFLPIIRNFRAQHRATSLTAAFDGMLALRARAPGLRGVRPAHRLSSNSGVRLGSRRVSWATLIIICTLHKLSCC